MAPTRPFERWSVFNLVGFFGMAVQLGVVAYLVHVLRWNYLLATALGVEAAVLHNFIWHHRWTWRDRPPSSRRDLIGRLGRFHLINGVVSLAGNVGLAALGTGALHIDPIVSNLAAVVVCASVNFAGSHMAVFRSAPAAGVLMLLLVPGTATAGPSSPALAAWRAYEAQLEASYRASFTAAPDDFFAHDRASLAPGWRQAVLSGTLSLAKVDAAPVDDGKIHHWVGAMFVPGLTVDGALQRLKAAAGQESASYEDVLASKLIERTDDRARVFMKLRRESVITVTYNTEHVVDYTRVSPTRALVRSVASKIVELADPGTPREHEKSSADDSGFLWRLNAYWRYQAVPGGVMVECESVSLSRGVPLLIRPVANPIVDRIARESLHRTLTSLRSLLTGAERKPPATRP
jgi:putative flippase GtrA